MMTYPKIRKETISAELYRRSQTLDEVRRNELRHISVLRLWLDELDRSAHVKESRYVKGYDRCFVVTEYQSASDAQDGPYFSCTSPQGDATENHQCRHIEEEATEKHPRRR